MAHPVGMLELDMGRVQLWVGLDPENKKDEVKASTLKYKFKLLILKKTTCNRQN